MTKTKKASSKKELYKLTLSLGADSYTKSGISILDCLQKMEPKTNVKSVGKFVCEYKGKKSAIPITINRTKLQRIFTKQIELEMFAKRLSILL